VCLIIQYKNEHIWLKIITDSVLIRWIYIMPLLDFENTRTENKCSEKQNVVDTSEKMSSFACETGITVFTCM
jgi:hypothetical protein